MFWKKVSASKKTCTAKASDRIGNAIGPHAIAELWRSHFSAVFTSVTSDSDAAKTRAFSKPLLDSAKQLITIECVVKSLSGLSGSKSGGLDGVTANHLKHGGPSLLCVLSLLFNGFLNHSFVPDSLTEVCLVPVPKSSVGDMTSLSNYRPIALAAVVSKLFEKCVYDLILPQVDSSFYQFGFKDKSSTEFCIFILKSVIQYFWMFSSPVFVCFIDAKAAFDRVNHEKLFDKMSEKGVDARVIGTLHHWFKVQKFRIKWSGFFSQPFNVQNGVRQGGVLSPLLYNLYVDELNILLSRTGVGCFINNTCFNNISYADDLLILAPTVAALNLLLGVCDRFACEKDIVFNTKKTLCMAFIPRNLQLKHIPDALLSGVPLAFVSSFKYLGYTFTSTMSDETHVAAVSRSLCSRANILIRKFGKCEPAVKDFLFRSYCTPLYCLAFVQSIPSKCESRFRVLYNNSYRWLHGLPWNCSASGMFAGGGLPSFGELKRKAVFSVQSRILSSTNPLLLVLSGPYFRLSLPLWKEWTHVLYAVPVES